MALELSKCLLCFGACYFFSQFNTLVREGLTMPSTKLCRHKNDKDKDPTIKGLRLNSLWGRTYPHFSDKEKCNSQVYY